MAESYENADLETLRAMASGQGIDGAEEMEHDDLVEALRQAGLAGPAGSPPGEPDEQELPPGPYHGKGVGRRETVDDSE